MSTQTSGTATPSTPAEGDTRRRLKILMLHGYTQSGPLFHAKTRALEKTLHKAFSPSPLPSALPTKKAPPKSLHHPTYPGGIQLIYPTAPITLQPADIPGFSTFADTPAASEAFGWWKRETGSGLYTGLEESLSQIAALIRLHGGIDAVLGFSQGGAFAALIAALLEPGRREVFASNIDPSAFKHPEEWEQLRNDFFPEGLKLCVIYSGFYAPHPAYEAFYNPKIETRALHFIGSLDTVVEEHRSKGLVERTVIGDGKGAVVVHPGGHFVPVGKEMSGVLVGFVRDAFKEEKEEEGVEDMDVSF